MDARGKLIVALLAIEVAIAGEALVAFRGGGSKPFAVPQLGRRSSADARLTEGGPHRVFDAVSHAAVTIDIGYADLTIVAQPAPQIDIGVSESTDFGLMRANSAFVARRDGDAIRIGTSGGRSWSAGDDRRVTVTVPAETVVTVLDAGDIEVHGLRASASIKSVGRGSVAIDDYAAPSLRIASSSGDIAMHHVAVSRLEVASRDGRVEGSALRVRDGSVETDGRVMLGFAAGTDALVTAEASSGTINVAGIPDVSSAPGSRTTHDGASQTVRIGAGAGHLDVHSNDGNITLAREG